MGNVKTQSGSFSSEKARRNTPPVNPQLALFSSASACVFGEVKLARARTALRFRIRGPPRPSLSGTGSLCWGSAQGSRLKHRKRTGRLQTHGRRVILTCSFLLSFFPSIPSSSSWVSDSPRPITDDVCVFSAC